MRGRRLIDVAFLAHTHTAHVPHLERGIIAMEIPRNGDPCLELERVSPRAPHPNTPAKTVEGGGAGQGQKGGRGRLWPAQDEISRLPNPDPCAGRGVAQPPPRTGHEQVDDKMAHIVNG